MIDWTTIIVTGIGLFSVSGAGIFIFYRANKGGATADAISKAAEAMRQMIANAEQQQTTFNRMLEGKDKTIEMYEFEKLENKRLISEQSYKISELERKVAGNAREIGSIKQSLTEVEGVACLEMGCKLRRPTLGTYKHKTE